MKATIKLLAACLLALPLFGCPPISATSTPPSIPATGSAIEQTKAYIQSADSEVKSSVSHADAVGQALLNEATKAHASATAKLGDASAQLMKVQADFTALAKTSDAQKVKDQATIKTLTDQNTALTKSWGHRLQVFVTWAFWVIVILSIFHAVGVIVAKFLPAPYGTILSIVANIVNPFGWAAWLAGSIGAKKAAQAAAAANSLTVNFGTGVANAVQGASGLAGTKENPIVQ